MRLAGLLVLILSADIAPDRKPIDVRRRGFELNTQLLGHLYDADRAADKSDIQGVRRSIDKASIDAQDERVLWGKTNQ